jgi:hypothetical protein
MSREQRCDTTISTVDCFEGALRGAGVRSGACGETAVGLLFPELQVAAVNFQECSEEFTVGRKANGGWQFFRGGGQQLAVRLRLRGIRRMEGESLFSCRVPGAGFAIQNEQQILAWSLEADEQFLAVGSDLHEANGSVTREGYLVESCVEACEVWNFASGALCGQVG